MMDELPKRCFISYSYKDENLLKELLQALPQSAEPITFRPITVTPDEMVSSELIKTILDCNGLIYLKGGNSADSFWVAFERDYALRAGKEVFAFDPTAREILHEQRTPLSLPVYPLYERDPAVEGAVVEILHFMREQRFFDLFIDQEEVNPGESWAERLYEELKTRLDEGGYAVLFLAGHAASNKWIDEAIRLSGSYGKGFDRVLITTLRDFPWHLGESTKDRGKLVPPTIIPGEEPTDLFVSAAESELLENRQILPLYQGTGIRFSPRESPGGKLPHGIDQNRLDDLIVRLYWLIFQNSELHMPQSH